MNNSQSNNSRGDTSGVYSYTSGDATSIESIPNRRLGQLGRINYREADNTLHVYNAQLIDDVTAKWVAVNPLDRENADAEGEIEVRFKIAEYRDTSVPPTNQEETYTYLFTYCNPGSTDSQGQARLGLRPRRTYESIVADGDNPRDITGRFDKFIAERLLEYSFYVGESLTEGFRQQGEDIPSWVFSDIV
ncbi:uncharacterized protein L201_007923 [Kwoniella dendrophila CBS 6074]|uniref:Uncharacterized protein n=1 Tax=Kwoniella dendrophila CBS 6074 TaxID=1295534 RepID=A0AAX4K7Y7_9TREE